MKDKLYVDGKDAFVEYGAFVRNGGYASLVAYAPLKTVDYNDWPEEDGIDADLSAPVLDTRTFDLPLAVVGEQGDLGALIEKLSDGAYHDFYLKEIERRYRLRLVSVAGSNFTRGLELADLSFADDFPWPESYEYLPPESSVFPSGHRLDGRDLSEYGISVLQGSTEEILKPPAVKQNLLRNISTRPGAAYDAGAVFFQSKEAGLNCLMRADTPAGFWRNYDALLYDLIRPETRLLHVDRTGHEYACYYKSCSTTRFCPTGRIWFQFTLTLVFPSFRIGSREYLLASEDGKVIGAEDGINAINLSKNGN